MASKLILVCAALLCCVELAIGLPKLLGKTHRLLPDGRIVGGQDADIKDHPHQISLLWYGGHICGGSIVDETHVVTAGHCTDGSSASTLSVRAGSSILEQGGQVVDVLKIDQNPDFDYWTLDFDVSVLTLSEPLQLGENVAPISLPSQEVSAGTTVTVTGWGTTSEGAEELPKQLQAVQVPIVDRASCTEAYQSINNITPRMICAGEQNGGKDSCQGDSGGPLTENGVLYGIVSWGVGCAEPGYPGVYSNVAELRSYIDSILSK